jgi:hypothetical protein
MWKVVLYLVGVVRIIGMDLVHLIVGASLFLGMLEAFGADLLRLI